MSILRVGNGAGFWGDSPSAPGQLLRTGNLDYLTLEYLAELTLSILAHQKSKNRESGFVTDVPAAAVELASLRREGSSTRLVTNGGGMNPVGCARKVANELLSRDLPDLKIGVVVGDDFAGRLDDLVAGGEPLANLDTGQELATIRDRIASANVYLGAKGIVEALADEADIVLTGRIADASLVTGPCIHEFGWRFDQLDRIANATVAGHLIECGAQVTGGFFSGWTPEIRLGTVGYPIAEINELGESIITKPDSSGGVVNEATCAEQLIYEIGDPTRYLTPDVIADFSHVRFKSAGPNRVQATGGRANGIPEKLKASIAYYDGFMISSMIVVAGPGCVEKAEFAGKAIFEKLANDGIQFRETRVEILGAGDSMPGARSDQTDPWEVVLRVSARSDRKEHTDRLGRELAPLVTSGPPGITGYTGSRPRSTPVLSFWPTLVSREHFETETVVQPASQWAVAR
ncbi:MAG: acyclic terpene utilization AtuA family protein [Planctomycetota bacterium]|nr:acyclic terpene utilization AtuA family protein [Planctomycetota bacterium]